MAFGLVWISMTTVDATSQEAERWWPEGRPVPELNVPATLEQWKEARKEIRRTLERLLGELPPRPKEPRVRVVSKEEKDWYTVEKFEFDNEAGSNVPGYLVVPKNLTGKVPAILYCHWHGGQYDNGKEELFKTAHTPEMPAETLARRGYVVIAIDAYCFGERNGRGPGQEKGGSGEMTASKFNLWLGRSLWGMILRDDLMALDYLLSRPEVDTARVGVTGISMGATRSWWLMALDERIQAGVAVACLTRYQDLIQAGGLKHHGIYYYVPGMLKHFDTEAVISLIAPRPILFMTGDQDAGSPVAGIRTIETRVRPVYQLYEKEPQFRNVIYPGVGHVYLPEMWKAMLRWMDQHVKGRSEVP